jgi:hypothetical protein
VLWRGERWNPADKCAGHDAVGQQLHHDEKCAEQGSGSECDPRKMLKLKPTYCRVASC